MIESAIALYRESAKSRFAVSDLLWCPDRVNRFDEITIAFRNLQSNTREWGSNDTPTCTIMVKPL